MYDEKQVLTYLESKFEIQLLEKLGSGSFGTVYKAMDRTDNQECAIKILYKSDMGSSMIEGKLLQQLDHPHIVKFKRIGETKNTFVIIMELMKGGTIASLIKQRKQDQQPFTDEESSTIVKCILSAVDYMHSQNILHRDLKPENILLSDPGNLNSVKVADFGLGVQYSSEMTYRSFQQQCGTVLYMSPEQLKGQPYSKPVDLWSCGIIMYMILSMGKHPFNYNNEIENKEQYVKLLTGGSPKKIERWPNCTSLATDLIQRLTDNSPSNRYNAGKALTHPWITRRLEDHIPLSFEENRQIFQAKNSFINIIKTMIILKFFKKNATKKQLKRVSTRKNYSASSFLINTEQSEAQSPLIYNINKPHFHDTIQGLFATLHTNKQPDHEDEEAMISSPLQKYMECDSINIGFNSPQRKKEFMIKKVGPGITSQSPSSGASSKNVKQSTHASSFFKPTHSHSVSQNKSHNTSSGLNNSRQSITSVNQLNSSNDYQKKQSFQDYKQTFLNVNTDTSKPKIVFKESQYLRLPSTNSHSSQTKQEHLLPICLKIPEMTQQTQYISYNNNFNNMQNNAQVLNHQQKQQPFTNSNSNQTNQLSPPSNLGNVLSSGAQFTNVNNNNNSFGKGQNISNQVSTFYNKQRQLRQRPSMPNYSQKEIDEVKEQQSRRTGTAETKFNEKRKTGSVFYPNYSNNNSSNPNNTSINKIHPLEPQKLQTTTSAHTSPNTNNNFNLITNNIQLNTQSSSQKPIRQVRKLSAQFAKSGIRQSITGDGIIQNLEDFSIGKRPLKSSRIVSNFYENTKQNNE